MRIAFFVVVAGWVFWQVFSRFFDFLQVCEGFEFANGWRLVRRIGFRGVCLVLGRWWMELDLGQMSNIFRFGKRLVEFCSWMLIVRFFFGLISGFLEGCRNRFVLFSFFLDQGLKLSVMGCRIERIRQGLVMQVTLISYVVGDGIFVFGIEYFVFYMIRRVRLF